MDKLIFRVAGQHIETTPVAYASDTINIIGCEFQFSGEDWNGLDSIIAIFENRRVGKYAQVLDADGFCVVPPEVMTARGEVIVNLSGIKVEDGLIVERINTLKVLALEVTQKVNLSGDNSVPPTPDIVAQLLALVGRKQDRLIAGDNIVIEDNVISAVGGGGGSVAWKDIKNKPTEFPPSAHNHAISDVNGLENALKGKADADKIPTKTSELENDSNYVSDANYTHTDNNYTDADKTKLGELSNYDDTEIRAELTTEKQAIESIESALPSKLTEPSAMAVGQFFRIASFDENGHAVIECVDAPSYELPVASKTNLGGVRVYPVYGTEMVGENVGLVVANNSEIDVRTTHRKVVNPSNLVYAVNSVACSTKENEQLTDEQKANAQIRIGILSSEGVTF